MKNHISKRVAQTGVKLLLSIFALLLVLTGCDMPTPTPPQGTSEETSEKIPEVSTPTLSIGTVFDFIGKTKPEQPAEWSIQQFPGATFRCDYKQVEAITEQGSTVLMEGKIIRNVILVDLNYDANPEICATISEGSIIGTRVEVYDYANGETYKISNRFANDYYLKLAQGRPVVFKWELGGFVAGDIISVGSLCLNSVGTNRPLFLQNEIDIRSAPRTVTCNVGWNSKEEVVSVTHKEEDVWITVSRDNIILANQSVPLSWTAFFVSSTDPSGYSLCSINAITMDMEYYSVTATEDNVTLWQNGIPTNSASFQQNATIFGYIPKEEMQEVRQTLGEGCNFFVMGEFSDGYALYVQGDSFPSQREDSFQTVGPSVFRYLDASQQILFYRNGSLFTLEEALEKGLITGVDVGILRIRHGFIAPAAYAPLEEQIRKSYLEYRQSQSTIDRVRALYVYETEEFSTVIMNGGGSWWYKEFTETVAGVTFRYLDDSSRFLIYSNGRMYTLGEAYDAGLITAEDVQTINRIYTTTRPLIREYYKEMYDQ